MHLETVSGFSKQDPRPERDSEHPEQEAESAEGTGVGEVGGGPADFAELLD